MNAKPLVTVIMPAYNASTFIRESIKSVLIQNINNWDLFVVNDCSTDDTADIVRAYQRRDSRIKLIQNKQKLGPSGSRNRGIEQSKSKYIAFLDADDLMSSNSLALRMRAIEQNNLAIGSFAQQKFIDSNGRELQKNLRVLKIITFTDLVENQFATSMVMLKKIPGGPSLYFDTNFFYGEDWDLWLRLARTGMRFVPARNAVISRRVHAQSLSHSNMPEDFQQRMKVMELAWQEDSRVTDPLPAYRTGMMDAIKNEGYAKRAWSTMLCAVALGQFETAMEFWEKTDKQLIAVIPEKSFFKTVRWWLFHQTACSESDWPLIEKKLLKNLQHFSSENLVNNHPLLKRWISIFENELASVSIRGFLFSHIKSLIIRLLIKFRVNL